MKKPVVFATGFFVFGYVRLTLFFLFADVVI